jgi:hypothetical protein
MPWIKIDDRLHAHPKFVAAWAADPASVGLELFALSHSAAYLTDGAVDEIFVRSLFRSAARRRRAIAALVDAGLWLPTGDGWVIHDYLDYNESREALLERRNVRETKRRLNRNGRDATR